MKQRIYYKMGAGLVTTLALLIGSLVLIGLHTASAQPIAEPQRGGQTTIQFVPTTASTLEDTGAVTLTVALNQTVATTVTVVYSTTAGTATSNDYTAMTGTLSLPSGTLNTTFVISTTPDMVTEADEMFTVMLTQSTNASLGANSVATVTITSDDTAPTMQWSDSAYTVYENVGTAMFTVTLSNQSVFSSTVVYSTTDGTATAGMDYTPVINATLVCQPLQTECTVTVPITDDAMYEANEQFILSLNGPQASTAQTATVTIVDNEPPVISWQNTSVRVNESKSAVILTVNLSRVARNPVSLHYATSNGTAIAGQDYIAATGTITFTPGQTTRNVTITLNPANLITREPSETFLVTLSNPQNGTIADPVVTVTIVDNTVYLPLVLKINPPPPPTPVCIVPNEPGNNGLNGASLLLTNGQPCIANFTGEAVQASDYYKIELNQVGTFNLNLTLRNTTAPAAHDIDLFLYQLVGTQVQLVAQSRKGSQLDETIATPINGQGVYFVRVYWYESTAASTPTYSLTATTTP